MAKQYRVTVNGQSYDVVVEELGGSASVAAPAAAAAAPAPAAAPVASAPVAGATTITAPMPGTILSIKFAVGQSVKKGDVVVVLEAMKMENDITSPCDGVVRAIHVQASKTVSTGEAMVDIG